MLSLRNAGPVLGGPIRSADSARRGLLEQWRTLAGATRTRVKVGVLLIVTIVAYHYSLESLLQTVGVDTPLAYVGLVPFFAGGLAVLRRSPAAREPEIHDRELDYILGLPLVAVALVMVLVLPGRMGAMYWLDRVDLLSMPVFVAGATVLLFGTRVAWRQKAAICFLFLCWPWPYTTVLLGTLGGFTSVTLGALRALLHVFPLASPIPGSGGAGYFQVVHAGRPFPISVVTACSGVDGIVGFLLVGACFMALVTGPVLKKTLWLAVGLVLLWVANLVRLLTIFGAGKYFGEHLAINVLHPVAGMVFFCLGVVAMLLLLKPFGLRVADKVVASASPSRLPVGRHLGTSRIFWAVSVLALVGTVLGVNNSNLVAYNPVATAAGEPKLGSFLAQPAAPAGWRAAFVAEYEINKPLFGESSRWFRYLYTTTMAPGGLYSSLPVTADVINAAGLSGFSAFGVEACYSFHGYSLRDVAKVNLGEGITGQALSYAGSGSAEDWTLVYWIWPVKTATGTRYERIILYLQNTSGARVTVPGTVPGIRGLKGALTSSNALQRRLLTNRAFLVTFARDIVAGQVRATDTLVRIASLAPALGDQVIASVPAGASRELVSSRSYVAAGAAAPRAPGGPTEVAPAAALTGGLHAGPDWSSIRAPLRLSAADVRRIFRLAAHRLTSRT